MVNILNQIRRSGSPTGGGDLSSEVLLVFDAVDEVREVPRVVRGVQQIMRERGDD